MVAAADERKRQPTARRLTEGGLCGHTASNVAHWRSVVKLLPWEPRGGNTRGELRANGTVAGIDTAAAPYGPHWFCDKFPPNIEPLSLPRRLTGA